MIKPHVIKALEEERQRQIDKYGVDKEQSVAGYLLILEAELEEAKAGWMKNVPGKHSALSEIIQIAATAIACLEEYGLEGNPL